MKYKKIFIACPISKYLTDDGVNKEFEIFMKDIYKYCQNIGLTVFLALDREEYGRKKMYGADCTTADFLEMKESDLLIAFPEDSMGVSVELGWASAFKIETVVFIDKKYKQSELVKSINSVVTGKAFNIDTSNGLLNQLDVIRDALDSYVA